MHRELARDSDAPAHGPSGRHRKHRDRYGEACAWSLLRFGDVDEMDSEALRSQLCSGHAEVGPDMQERLAGCLDGVPELGAVEPGHDRHAAAGVVHALDESDAASALAAQAYGRTASHTCPLHSVVIAPLQVDGVVVGTVHARSALAQHLGVCGVGGVHRAEVQARRSLLSCRLRCAQEMVSVLSLG